MFFETFGLSGWPHECRLDEIEINVIMSWFVLEHIVPCSGYSEHLKAGDFGCEERLLVVKLFIERMLECTPKLNNKQLIQLCGLHCVKARTRLTNADALRLLGLHVCGGTCTPYYLIYCQRTRELAIKNPIVVPPLSNVITVPDLMTYVYSSIEENFALSDHSSISEVVRSMDVETLRRSFDFVIACTETTRQVDIPSSFTTLSLIAVRGVTVTCILTMFPWMTKANLGSIPSYLVFNVQMSAILHCLKFDITLFHMIRLSSIIDVCWCSVSDETLVN